MISRILIAFISIVLFPQCRTKDEPAPAPGVTITSKPVVIGNDASATLRVLFVGNSLTYENDLPSLVVEIAGMDGVAMSATMIAHGNYALEDHLNDGEVQASLKDNRFDFLVAQQGPSALPESQVLLKELSMQMAELCSRFGTKFALYMVWPALQRDFDRDNCIASYTNAANASGALLCPAGLAWKKAWAIKADLPLYGDDRFHPGVHGSVLAAMVIYASLQNKKDLDFIDLKNASFGPTISSNEMEVMKQAAIQSIQK